MGFLQEQQKKVSDFIEDLQGMAMPDKFLLVGLVSGLLLSQAISPAGRIAEYIETRLWKHPDWVPAALPWWRMVLIGIFVIAVVVYLVLRGNDDEKPIRKVLGRLVGAKISITTRLGNTTSQQETCFAVVTPVMFSDRRHPAPPYLLLCPKSSVQRFKLLFEPDNNRYSGTCDETAFHDDIISTMSTSPEVSQVMAKSAGRHFVEVDIMDDKARILPDIIAVCIGFKLKPDTVRDGATIT